MAKNALMDFCALQHNMAMQSAYLSHAGTMSKPVFFGNKKVAVRAPKARVSRRRRRRGGRAWGGGVPLHTGGGVFWSSKSVVLLHFECCFCQFA